MEWITRLWAEVMRLPWGTLFGLMVACTVLGGLLTAMAIGFVSDVRRFAQRRHERPHLVVRKRVVRERLTGRGAA